MITKSYLDPMLGTGIALLFGALALLFGFAALVRWIVGGRKPWFSTGAAGVCALVVLGCGMAMPPAYSESEFERVERLHAQFAPALERYRQQHGEYPSTLETAGIPTPTTLYGPLRYRARHEKDGTHVYSVAYGNYALNGFAAWWESTSRKWYIDS